MAPHLGFSFANTGACAQAQVHHSLLLWDNGIFYPRKRGIPVLVRMLKFKTEVKCPKMAAINLVARVRVTLDQRSGTRDSGIKRLPENKNPVIGQTAQASGIRTSGFTKCSHYSTRQLSFPWKN